MSSKIIEQDKELEEDGFEVCEILNSKGKFHGGNYLLLVIKRCEPKIYDGITGLTHQMGILPFETIANAQTIAGKYRNREDVLLVRIVAIVNLA